MLGSGLLKASMETISADSKNIQKILNFQQRIILEELDSDKWMMTVNFELGN